jgi:hypothetical protein
VLSEGAVHVRDLYKAGKWHDKYTKKGKNVHATSGGGNTAPLARRRDEARVVESSTSSIRVISEGPVDIIGPYNGRNCVINIATRKTPHTLCSNEETENLLYGGASKHAQQKFRRQVYLWYQRGLWVQ